MRGEQREMRLHMAAPDVTVWDVSSKFLPNLNVALAFFGGTLSLNKLDSESGSEVGPAPVCYSAEVY